MKNKRYFLARSPLSAALFVALITTSTTVSAQTATDTNVSDEQVAEAAARRTATDLDAVTVTGSRIRRAGFDTLEPATVVTRESIEAQGLTNIADALNRTPGFAGSLTPDGGQSSYNVGTNFINRFNLGTNRSLTLVNGRRFVSSNPATQFSGVAAGMQVDLNAIPTHMVDRIENVAIGGAPTYGSDAIAGVTNVILRRDYDGAVFSAGYGVTERGDNNRFNFSGLIGANFGENDRGNITFSISYDKVDGVLGTEREFIARQIGNPTNPLASNVAPGRTPANDGRLNPNTPFNTSSTDGIPNTVLIRDSRIFAVTPGGVLLNPAGTYKPGTGNTVLNGFGAGNNTYLQFDPSGNVVSYNPGIGFNQQTASGGDGWNLAEHTQLTSGIERKTVNLNTRWNVVEGVDVFFEGLHYQADAVELVDQTPFQSTLFGGLSGALRISATHPLLTQQARDTLASEGITSFGLGRASRDLYDNSARSNTKLSRAVIGFDGAFELADRTFYWEAYSNYGRAESFNFGTGLNQQRFVNAINVSRNALGQLICDPSARNATYLTPGSNGFAGGPAPVADPNCVPLDLFGEGRPSDAALAYTTYPTRARSLLEQQVYNANISSTLIDLWSGPLLYSLGYERRIERGSFEPDASLVAGLGRGVPITPLSGQYSTKEWFGEIVIPLVDPASDIPGLKKLEAIGKYRTVDNEVNGEFDSYTYGLQWKPINDLEVRYNFTRSLRAPAITELFLPVSSAFSLVPDPCDTRNISGGTKPDIRRQNCAAFLGFYGLPASGFDSTAVSATVPVTTGGNPALANESADSYSYGFTWAPSWDVLEGFVFSADYYNIDIGNVISSLNATEVAQACFDNDSFNASDIPNANAYCSLITRRSGGQVDGVQTGYVNGEFVRLEAYSAEMRYGFSTDRFGRFDFGASGYYPKEYKSSVTGVVVNDSASTSGVQRSYQLDTRWGFKNLSVGLAAYHHPKTQYSNTQTVETREKLSLDSYWLFNGSASYRINDKTQLRFAVSNLFDRDPPFPTAGLGSVYDVLGRRYNLSFEWQY